MDPDLAARSARRRGPMVAFAACSHGRGRVYSIAVPDARTRKLPCPTPGCGETHRTFMARSRQRGESCDISVDGASRSSPVLELAASRPRRPAKPRASAADVLAAIPTTPTPPDELAVISDRLGYSSPSALRKRLHRLNAAAEDRGEPPPVVFERIFGPGRQTTARRIVTPPDDDGERKP